MIALLIFLAVLSALVLVHELGHFLAAKLFGVKTEEFGYGFPPRLVGFVKTCGRWKRVKWDDQAAYPRTIWSLNWLPLGGFVRLKGEEGAHAADADAFAAKPAAKRFGILIAGVAMNWLLAAFIFIIGFTVGVPMQTEGLPAGAIVRGEKVQIVEVVKGSAADVAGIAPGDFVVTVNGAPPAKAADVHDVLVRLDAVVQPVTLGLARADKDFSATIRPTIVKPLLHPSFGLAVADTGIARFPFSEAVGYGLSLTADNTKMIVAGLGQLARDLVQSHRLPAGVSGPVGIAVLTSQVAAQGAWPVLELTALLSLNLAVINFLPIPGLDGGRALFVVIGALRRRQVSAKREALVHRLGFLALAVFLLIITAFDIHHYGGMIWQGVRHAVGM